MKRAIKLIIGEMEGKLNGYAVLLNYRYMNLCVKVEPAALVPVAITDNDGQSRTFEEVAGAMSIDEYTFEICPFDQKLIFNICKGLKLAHPEFKQEIIKAAEEDMLSDDPDEDERHILCHMPEVNDDRRDVLMDGVKVLYDQCMVEVNRVKGEYTPRMAQKVIGLPEEEIDEATNALEERFDLYKNLIDQYRANKEKEIEDAHQKWLNERSEQARQRQEDAATHGDDKAHAFNMYDNE